MKSVAAPAPTSRLPRPRLETEAERILVLAPDWRDPFAWLPALSTYTAAAPVDGSTCLVLDARAPLIAPELVRTVVGRAAEYLSEGRPFAEVILLEDPVEIAAGAELVASGAEVAAHLGRAPRALHVGDPLTVVSHARWAKALADGIQGDVDAFLLDAAAPVRPAGRPFVTVRIPTWGDTELLLSRAIPSVLAGAYANVEILVCSDGPQPHAREAVSRVADTRVRYLELDERPVYPERRKAFWHTAGTHAVNRLVEEARGEFIAPLDHDDAFTQDHIPQLLGALARTGADFAYGQAMTEHTTGGWGLLGDAPLTHGRIVHAAVLYSRRLAHMRYDPEAWLLDEPGDWNLWRRMQAAGAEIVHVPAPVAVHFREGSSIADRAEDAARALGDAAEDLLGTPARRLLEIASPIRGVLGGEPVLAPRRPLPAGRSGRRSGPRRLAVLDTDLPLWLSGFRHHEFSELLTQAPDTVFFSANRTGEDWPRPVHPLGQFAELAPELGITDAYAVFLNFTVSLLGLQRHRGAATCGGIPADFGVAAALRAHGIRLHTTLYPGGGLVEGTDPALLRAVADRCATVFTNTAEVVAAVPRAIRLEGPMATDFYAFRPRERRPVFHAVFAADDRPRKGLDTALAAFARLDPERFHLHVAGPHERALDGYPAERVTAHGVLRPAELRGLYWAADAFVSPVRREGPDGRPGEVGLVDGFPTTTACEALAAGCALVSSNPRSEHWIVRPDEHFLEFPVGDDAALAAALEGLEADRALRDALAERGSARIHEAMDVRRVAGAKLAAMGLVPAPA